MKTTTHTIPTPQCSQVQRPDAKRAKDRAACPAAAHWRFHVRGMAEHTYFLCDDHAKAHMRALKKGTLEWSATPLNIPGGKPSEEEENANERRTENA